MYFIINTDYLTTLSISGVFHIPSMGEANFEEELIEAIRKFFVNNRGISLNAVQHTFECEVIQYLYAKHTGITPKSVSDGFTFVEAHPMNQSAIDRLRKSNGGEQPIVGFQIVGTDANKNYTKDDYFIAFFYRGSNVIAFGVNMIDFMESKCVDDKTIHEVCASMTKDDAMLVCCATEDKPNQRFNVYHNSTFIETQIDKVLEAIGNGAWN